MTLSEREPKLGLAAFGIPLLQIPFALVAPAEADRAVRDNDLAGRLVIGDGLPFGICCFAESCGEIRGAHEPLRHEPSLGFHQPHQKWHVRILARVVDEVLGLPVDVEFAQDDVAHGHAERGIGALLRRHPEIGEFRGLGIVRADHDALRALVAGLGVEVGVGRARLRHVRAPKDQEAGIVPVGRFRHVGLLAPGLRAGRRQVAIPVVERHAHAAEQREVARARGVAHHRHRRDRREAEHPVRSIGLDRVGVRRGDQFVDLIPGRTDETAKSAFLNVGVSLRGIFDDRLPRRDRSHQQPGLAPRFEQARAHQRILHPVCRIEIPAVAGAPRASARLVVRQVRPRARIIGLLGFPGDDPAFDVDLPRARAGAVHAMRGPDDLVVLPALAVAVLPAPVLMRGDAVTVGKRLRMRAGRRSIDRENGSSSVSFLRRAARRRLAASGQPADGARRRRADRRGACRSPR